MHDAVSNKLQLLQKGRTHRWMKPCKLVIIK